MRRSKIIIVSEDFYPSNLVSSRRITYWARNLSTFLPSDITLKIIANNPKSEKTKEIKELVILKRVYRLKFLQKISNLIQLILNLRKEKNSSIIIFSAGPFYYLLTSWFIHKKHFVIFDLRDPFVSDSKNTTSKLKKLIKFIFQIWFLKQPNAIITINEFLKNDFKIPKNLPYAIIPNGIESIKFKNSVNSKKVLILGKVYENLEKFITQSLALFPEMEFHQFINKSTSLEINLLPSMKNVFIHDEINQEEIDKIGTEYEFGLVSSFGKDFVLPVKIFDYIRFNHKIIIINDAPSTSTELKVFLQNYKNTYFCYDQNIDHLQYENFVTSERQILEKCEIDAKYFRHESTKLLADFINTHLIASKK